MNESVIIKIPTRILKEEIENVNGTTFRWIDMSKILSIDGYGCWFPSWLITVENRLISKIEIQDKYTIYGQTNKKENILMIEHKEKVSGKKFKRYKYTATDFAKLFLSYYDDWYRKLEECKKTYCLAVAASYSEQGRIRNDDYHIGYIVDGFFYDCVNESNESKRISAKSFNVIVDNLNVEKAYIAKELIEELQNLKVALQDINSDFDKVKRSFAMRSESSYGAAGLITYIENINNDFNEAFAFLEKKINITEETLKGMGEDKTVDYAKKECEKMCLQPQDLGHGLKKGINNITESKVMKWRHNSPVNWLVLLWDLAEYFKLIDFGNNWFKVDVQSTIQRENLYKKVTKCGTMQEHNFYIDIDNDLWKTHKPNAENNFAILERIIKEVKDI